MLWRYSALLAAAALASSCGGGESGPSNDATIAFSSCAISDSGSPENCRVLAMDAAGTQVTNITEATRGRFDAPTDWYPDGTQLTVVSCSKGDLKDVSTLACSVQTVNVDGSEQKQLTAATGPVGAAKWSPDGSRIAFSSCEPPTSLWDAACDLVTVAPDGSGQAAIFDDAEQFDWSPDGKRIALTSGPDEKENIFVVNADGSDAINVTGQQKGLGNIEQPAWSPDGRRIAFFADHGVSADIYVMNADGSDPATIASIGTTEGSSYEEPSYEPAWSPEGDRIAFADDGDLFVVNVGGSGRERLTEDGGNDHPVWSPKNGRIAFVCVRGEAQHICTVDGDGKGPAQLSSAPGRHSSPVWRGR